MEIKQYQIVLVNLDPTIGNTAEKTRPCVVISPDEMNKYLRTVVIAPLASGPQSYPTRVKIRQNNKISRVALDQIMTVERLRIVKELGILSQSEIKKIKAVLKETFVD